MKLNFKHLFLLSFVALVTVACSGNKTKGENKRTLKGLYIFGPEIKSFTDCKENTEYWVADSARTLELAYNNFNFEKPYEPVYVEFECTVVPSDTTMSADFDSTIIVRKLITISKKIPDGPCTR